MASHCIYTRVDEVGERFSFVGVCCVVCGNIVIACAMNILKHMAYVIPKPSNVDPNQIVLMPDRKSPWWWTGVIMKMLGETMCLLANGFAAASVVAVLSTTSAIFHALFALVFFSEKTSKSDYIGMCLIGAGSLLSSLFGPGRGYNLGAAELISDIIPRPQAWTFSLCMLVTLILSLFVARQWGETQLLSNVVVSSLFTMVAVMATKAYASIAKLAYFNGEYLQQFSTFVPWISFMTISISSSLAALFLNRAVTTWGNREVIPIFIFISTLLILFGSASIYGEFECSDPLAIILFAAGGVMALQGVFLISIARSDKTLYTISAVHQLQPIKAQVLRHFESDSTSGSLYTPRPFTYKERVKALAREIIYWPKFSIFYVGMVLVNILCFIYTAAAPSSYGLGLILIELFATLVLLLEVCIRYVGTDNNDFFKHGSNIFDLVIALLSIFAFALLVFIPTVQDDENPLVLNILRVIRDIIRFARVVVFFKNYRRLRKAALKRVDLGNFDLEEDLEEIDRQVVSGSFGSGLGNAAGGKFSIEDGEEGGGVGGNDGVERDGTEEMGEEERGGGVGGGGIQMAERGKPPLPDARSRNPPLSAADKWWKHVEQSSSVAAGTPSSTSAAAAAHGNMPPISALPPTNGGILTARTPTLRTPVLPSPPTRSPMFAAVVRNFDNVGGGGGGGGERHHGGGGGPATATTPKNPGKDV